MAAFEGERFTIPVEDEEEEEEEVEEEEEGNSSSTSHGGKGPIVIVVIGMAGSGKTTLMHRINLQMVEAGLRGYYVNLDPAVKDVPFGANIDIRDTIDYKEVMKQYGLGPNGAILTSLNLFATRFDQVINLIEKRSSELDYIFIDTPGQIETFTWSAGGQIILELLSTTLPTTIMYVTDTPRCQSPTTFMSNMLYASSVLYKSQLPLICVFNKTDVVNCDFALKWMQDFEAYQEAVDKQNKDEYMTSLNRSLSLAMDEFYSNIRAVGVSAMSGEGIEELFSAIDAAGQEFTDVFLPELLKRMEIKAKKQTAEQQDSMKRLQEDLRATKGDKVVVDAKQPSV